MIPKPKGLMITERIIRINGIASELCHERREQINTGSDVRDQHHSVNDWVAITAMHLGIAACDKDVPADLDRFEIQMIAVGAIAMAAVEWVRNRKEKAKFVPGAAGTERIPNQEDK